MNPKTKILGLVLMLAVFLTACGGAATPDVMMEEKPEEAMMDKATETPESMMEKSTPAPEGMIEDKGNMMEAPAWFSATLTDARTGQPFSIQDFKGKVVLVETMAMWCSNCLKQQGQVKQFHEMLGERDDFVSVGLDIDPNENVEALKGYVESNGFDWYYAVSPVEVSREIAALYGDQFLNPPSTPILVIDRKGVAHSLPFGIKSAEELLQAIQPFLDESM